ncbi:hypothetical protein LPJ78_003411 [Coemansia sp. RSA 989]|nr:PIG-P-domain-containing protein [Coemansia mojavensis]KAJ1741830.1 hypothetical protein LPJ68_002497 [Coemansia sp. RSA 1086]KAJ1749867.1 hypothetical protein LPJ79_003362 [Coemansia sp. RSA 1821]KAJ1864396.1 hypothetical protein LPJ78_003411 [Coemansia sp. RSA 989]KAJ1874973.1 hypothetical protein LPJ55_001048 [Coemansia sp. RSA 990]KAJ2626910.1 hypothetical protein H4R22_004631 [Coemansia sp. RSA 1290]KAJ2675407.1 hypothetical protein IWW42_001193 [Coemansia sp. RSA 1085]
MYASFRQAQEARQRRRRSNATLAEHTDSDGAHTTLVGDSHNSTASNRTTSSPGTTADRIQRPVSMATVSSLPSMQNDQELSGMFETMSSLPSSDAEDAAAPSTPTFEYYGFVVYLVSLAAFILYLLWAYLPDEALEAVGITYYPDRYWAVALPAWWLMAVGFICLFNIALNMYNTPLLSSPDNITDPYSNLPKDMADVKSFYYEKIGGIPPVCDIPISLVNECLHNPLDSDFCT